MRDLGRSPRLVEYGLPALTVMFGMQTFRTLLPLLVYLLRDRMGWTAPLLGVYALALFALSFLAAPLWRLLGVQRTVVVTAGGLGVLRLGMQLWRGDPVVVLGLASLATVFFIIFVPSYLLTARGRGIAPTSRFAIAVLLGLLLDTALHGVLLTWDLVWREDFWAAALAAVLVVGQLALVALWRRPGAAAGGREGMVAATGSISFGAGRSLPVLGVGPLLALALLVFENIARLGALTGWRLSLSYAVVMLAQTGGVVVAVRVARRPLPPSMPGLSILGVLLVLTTAVPPRGILLPVVELVVGQLSLAALVVVLLQGVGGGGHAPSRPARLSAASGAGMLVLVVLLFLTYSGYDIALPFSADVLLPAASAILAVCAVTSAFGLREASRLLKSDASPPGRDGRVRGKDAGSGNSSAICATENAASRRPVRPGGQGFVLQQPSKVATDTLGLEERAGARAGRGDRLPVIVAVALLVLPVAVFVQVHPRSAPPPTREVRVMTFNVHNGAGTSGRLGLEALARAIEQQDPDIVALQEVDRGWVIDGSTDLVEWLSQRLQMWNYAYGPTAGPLWGNAILSRYPLVGHDAQPLPTDDLLLRRGYIKASIDTGGGTPPLQVIATHYHHLSDGSAIRVQESQAILDAWGGRPDTVVMGDLNGEPGSPEIEMLRRAGLVEALQYAGIRPGLTFASDDPYQRIDYIWVSPDLAATAGGGVQAVQLTTGTASDHLGIAASLPR